MSNQLLVNDYIDFQFREMENDVKMIKENAEILFKILDEYEKLVENKSRCNN